MSRPAALLLVVATLILAPSARAQDGGFADFVARRGDQLIEGGQPLRFISFNIPNLLVIEDAFEFLGDSPWRWPDEFEINDALESIHQMGGRVARSYVLSVRREGSDMGECVHVLGPGEFNEEAFAALDLVLKVATEKGVRVIIPLVDNWKWMGGVGQYAAFRGKEEREFWTDPQLMADFKQTIDYIVNRKNSLTGVRYRDDKAILAWETGNELDAPPAWTAEVAAYLKQVDPNHLVIDGRSLHGIPPASLDDPNVDIVTTHHYPSHGGDIAKDVETAARAARGKKPYLVGEVGFIPVEEARRVLSAAVDNNAVGALYWSLRFHRREGGFYWHSEPDGANVFKAYHWPGFDSGGDYREREMLAVLVEQAARINAAGTNAEAPREPTPPLAARLLPIEHPGRVSWQGAAGASGYNVERAQSTDGPWATIGENVSDAATQYRPLFSDAGAEPGRAYYYRVTARNAAGAGPASNFVGPVTAKRALAGAVQSRRNEPRRAQEDTHRLELAPGGSVTYELPRGVVDATVWAFAAGEPACRIEVSRDGREFAPLETHVAGARRGAGDYGYWDAILLRASSTDPQARFVRIVNAAPASEGEGASFQLSRVELLYGEE
jgi:mannan endo-1,4-beta-mannosidase